MSQAEQEIKEVIELALEKFSEAKAHQIGFAAMYAQKSHQGQSRLDGEEFIMHPLRVAKKLLRLRDSRVDDVTIIAALLHDVVEDTNKTLQTIQMQFGRDVSGIVDALTKKPGQNQEETDETYFQQIRQAAKKDSRVGLIKVCDQIDNSQDMSVYSAKRKKQRLSHLKDVFIPLAQQLENDTLIQELTAAYESHQE